MTAYTPRQRRVLLSIINQLEGNMVYPWEPLPQKDLERILADLNEPTPRGDYTPDEVYRLAREAERYRSLFVMMVREKVYPQPFGDHWGVRIESCRHLSGKDPLAALLAFAKEIDE